MFNCEEEHALERVRSVFRLFLASILMRRIYAHRVTVEMFRQEVAEAMKAYDRYVVCIEKTPEEFEASLISLLNKAIKAYESRGPNLRHGIALDRQVTVILSQNDSTKPLCGIYFNLHSPYQKTTPPRTVKPLREAIGGGEG
jgi:hypothetical protein